MKRAKHTLTYHKLKRGDFGRLSRLDEISQSVRARRDTPPLRPRQLTLMLSVTEQETTWLDFHFCGEPGGTRLFDKAANGR